VSRELDLILRQVDLVALNELVVGLEVGSVQLQQMLVRFQCMIMLAQVQPQLPLQLVKLQLVEYLSFAGLQNFEGLLIIAHFHVAAYLKEPETVYMVRSE